MQSFEITDENSKKRIAGVINQIGNCVVSVNVGLFQCAKRAINIQSLSQSITLQIYGLHNTFICQENILVQTYFFVVFNFDID